MVSLENKIGYLLRIAQNPKLKAFNNLLTDILMTLPRNDNLNESDAIYFGVINAIQTNDTIEFKKYYDIKSKSRPNKESSNPFVNDDFLIFSLIVGINKFNIDNTWIRNIISIRNRNSITITFENILNNNLNSTSNLPEIVMMFLYLNNKSLITNDFLNLTFKSINENTTLFEDRSDFRILCSIHAYNYIIQQKEVTEGSKIYLFDKFNEKFIRRTKVVSWILQYVLLLGLIYGLLNLPKYSSEVVLLIDEYNYAFTLLGAFGITFFSNLVPVVRKKSHEYLMMLLGYPRKLLINKEKQN